MTWLRVAPEVESALASGAPVVGLESAVIAHGLPPPHSLCLALEVEQVVCDAGAAPAVFLGLERGFRCSKPCQVLHLNNSKGFWRDVAVLGRVSLTDA